MHALQSLPLAALLALAPTAAAQSTDCHTDQIPLQLTNFALPMSVPKFDPSLGQLLSIELRIVGTVRGSARVESLDAAASQVATQFAADVDVQQASSSVVMFMIPVANFLDTLAPFDGTIDYGGGSGVTHANIEVSDQLTSNIPLTPENLALYTGSGTVDFLTTATAMSSATGSGNVIAQFDTSVSVDLQVCYTFLANNPPAVNCPGSLMASAGVPVQFQVCGTDPDAGDVVTLNGVLPPGAVANPPFPVVGNPACTTITFTPTIDQVGDTQFVFTVDDGAGAPQTCVTVVTTAECHMIFGTGGGSSSVTLFGHLYDTQLSRVRVSFPVTMVDMPSIAVQALPPVITVQVVMYNPQVFPDNASQWSSPLTVYRQPDDSLTWQTGGHANGIHINAEVFQQDGLSRVRFPFTIDGM